MKESMYRVKVAGKSEPVDQEKFKSDDMFDQSARMIFYERHYGKFFEATVEQVLLAEYHLNRNFALMWSVPLNMFFDFLGVKAPESCSGLGWSFSAGMEYGYTWIDFEHIRHEMDNGIVYMEISMPFEPTVDYESD